MEDKRKELGALILNIIKEKNLKKSKILENTNISRTQLNKLLRGDNNYTVDTLLDVVNAIGCKITVI